MDVSATKNYDGNLLFTGVKLTLDDAQTIVKGVSAFAEPAVKGMDGETVAGTVTYSYQGKTTYDEVVAELKTLGKGAAAEVPYTFTIAENGNYTGRITGKLSLTVVDMVISGADAALTVKDKPVYGDSWGSSPHLGQFDPDL